LWRDASFIPSTNTARDLPAVGDAVFELRTPGSGVIVTVDTVASQAGLTVAIQ